MAGRYKFREYANLVEREVGEALRRVAEKMPTRIERNYWSGVDPAGNPQRPNTEVYRESKTKRGLGTQPCVKTGEMASGYVAQRTGQASFEVKPTKKTSLFRILQAKGFNLIGMPPQSREAAEKELAEAAKRIESHTGGLKS